MSRKIHIEKAGIQSLIVGPPSYSGLDLGIQIGGPMDQQSAAFANSLLSKDPNSPIIEMCLVGASFQFDQDSKIAICGADMNALLDNQPVIMNEVIDVRSGSRLSFGATVGGCRTYLAIEGQLDSKYEKFEYQQLKKDETLLLDVVSSAVVTPQAPLNFSSSVFQLAAGPDFSLFAEDELKELLSGTLKIEAYSNRMAYVCQTGTAVDFKKPFDSTAMLPGTVQLTPSGQLNILMRDCQTTGGYPRIGILSEEDINRLAQKKPGEQIELNWNR